MENGQKITAEYALMMCFSNPPPKQRASLGVYDSLIRSLVGWTDTLA